MRVTIDIDTENDAFQRRERSEVARIMRVVAARLGEGFKDGRVRDLNGNAVCTWESTDVA